MPAPPPPAHIPLDMLMLAYREGLFPMAESRDNAGVFWVEPKRRAILPPDGLHCSRSLARRLRRGTFTVSCNADFAGVIAACAAPRVSAEHGETWLNAPIMASYIALHHAGHAHSIEVWQGEGGARRLVGGLYGVGFDRVFCGESMFSTATDASKVALAWLVAALRLGGCELIDCQFLTAHLASLGAREISQRRYLALLRHAQRPADQWVAGEGDGVAPAAAPPLPAAFAGLLAAAKSAGSSSSPGNFIAQSLTHTS